MGNINLLDDLTINKIAAGEVIERPASAVKELVENSIDAGATNITVEIKNGGISYIRVTDNGKGLLPDDMEIAFERHATSKIRVAQDIETAKSMGFRGEALASIAAIARVTMKSKTEQNYTGNQIIIEGGNVIATGEVGCPNGTSITIENLFYNTPVRYKFLKKDFTESGYIEDIIARVALSHPEISIKYINTGKTIISTSGNGDIKSVIYAIYGKGIAENTINVNYEYENIKISGVVGKPEIARSNRSNQIFFVNKRYIKDKILTAASEQAFKNLIPVGKYGFIILNIEIDPTKVDVNVHPAKLEVRFQEEQNIFKAVLNAIKNALGNFDTTQQRNTNQNFDWNIKTKYTDDATSTNFIENNLRNREEIFLKKLAQKRNLEENKNRNKIPEFAAKEIQNDESKGFFKKLLAKKEKEEEPTLVEQLYQARKQGYAQKDEYVVNTFNSIMNKMAEMQKSVREFNENQDISKEETENNLEKQNITIGNEQGSVQENKFNAVQGFEQPSISLQSAELGQVNGLNINQEPSAMGVNEQSPEQVLTQISELSTNQEVAITQANEQNPEQMLAVTSESSINQEPTIMRVNEQNSEQALTAINKLSINQEPTIVQVNEQSPEQVQTQAREQSINQEPTIVQANEQRKEQALTSVIEPSINQETTTMPVNEQSPAQVLTPVRELDTNQEPTIMPTNERSITQELATAYTNTLFTKQKIEQNTTNAQQNNFEEMYDSIFGTNLKSATVNQVNEKPEIYTIPETQEPSNINISLFEPLGESNTPKYKYIGTVFGNFIVMEVDKELYILDQIAANEKIIYEESKQEYENNKEIDTQLMLLPDIINLTEKQMLIVEDNKEIFQKAGFMLEQFGQNTIKLTGVPSMCMNLDTEELFLEILEQINKVARTDRQAIEEKLLTTMASKVAQNSAPVSTPEDVEKLMKELLKQPNAFTMGSEKQVTMRLSKADIEKKFSRR